MPKPPYKLEQYKGPTSRLLAIILRLSQSKHWAAWSLAKELGVHERTIYRDLNRIRVAGLPIQYDEECGGYRIDWNAPMKMPPSPKKLPWQDREVTCGQCGRTFIWTARQQATRATNVKVGRVPPDHPPLCSSPCAARFGKKAKLETTK